MQLSSAQFSEIAGVCVLPIAGNAPDSDRRQSHRFSLGSRATIRPARKGGEAMSCVVMLRDISVESIGFLHAEQIRVGEQFVIQLSGDEGRLFDILCIARRCEPGGTGGTQWAIGATFEQIVATIDANAAAGPADAKVSAPVAKGGIFEKRPSVPVPQSAPIMKPLTTQIPMQQTASAASAAQDVPAVVELPETFAEVFPNREEEMPTSIIEEVAPVIQPPQPVTAVHAEPVKIPAAPAPVQYQAPTPVHQVAATPQPVPPPAPTAPTAPTGRNQEVLAKVKAALLNQNQVLQTHAHLLDAGQKKISEQTSALAHVTQQRDELAQKYARAEQQIAETRNSSSKKVEELERSLTELNQLLAQLQAKSESDDRAIAELAELFNAATGAASPAANAT